MDNNELIGSDYEKKDLKSTADYYLSSVFHKTLQNQYIPIIKPGIHLSNIIELFNCLFPRKNLNLKQLALLINTMYSLFCTYPPLIHLIHANVEKGLLYKQLILLEIDLIENASKIKNKEELTLLNNSVKNIIQLSVKYYDCPRIYYTLVYQKIASLTLWKTEGFDSFSFPPQMFQRFIDLLQVLYEAGNTEHKISFIIPKKYFVMNGSTSICFQSNKIKSISLKNRVYISWFFIPSYQFTKEEDTSIIEIKIKSKSKNKNDESITYKQIGIFFDNENHKIYFKNDDNKKYLEREPLKKSKWYAIKYSFVTGNIILFDTCECKTYMLSTKQRLEDDVFLSDIILYRDFFGITTCSFIILLPSSDSNQNVIFPGIEEPSGNKEDNIKDTEKKLFNRFNKYGIYNAKIKNYFCNKISDKGINFDLLVCPFQIYTQNNKSYIEHKEISAFFKLKENVNYNFFSIVNHHYDLKRINIIGGVNVFLPLFEIILSSKNKYLEKEEYICSLLELVANVVGKNKFNYMNATYSKFFNCLGLFMGKINKEIYGRNLWAKLLWIHRVFEGLCYSFPIDVKKNITKYNSYYKHVLFNYKIYGKFNLEILTIVCKNIYDNLENLERSDYPQGDPLVLQKALYNSFNLKTLTFYLRKLDQQKYNKYCCFEHRNLLKNPNERIPIIEPSMKQKFTIFENIIVKLLLDEFQENDKNKKEENAEIFFLTLTLDISPCFHEFILTLLKKLLKDMLKNNKQFHNFLRRIKIMDIFVLLIATSFYPIRLLVIKLIYNNKEFLLSLKDSYNNSNLFDKEQLLVISLCSKPLIYQRKQSQDISFKSTLTHNQFILNSEYKETEKLFKTDQFDENTLKFGENFIFFNVHPEIKEDLEVKYYRTLFPLINENKFKDNESFWFDCLLLNLSRYSKNLILDEIPSFFSKEVSLKGNAKYSFRKENIKADNFVFTLLEICFLIYCDDSKRGDPNYENLIPAIYDCLCNERVEFSFYQNFLIWFMYHFTIFKAFKDEYMKEKEMYINRLFKYFEEKIIKYFLDDKSYSIICSQKIEVVAYFLSIYYDYLFSFKNNLEFVYIDQEMCHLISPANVNEIELFEGNNIKNSPYVFDKQNSFKFDIPKYFYLKDKNKIYSITNLFFSFCNSLMLPLQIPDSSNIREIEESIKKYSESIKKKPKGTNISDYFGFLFCPPHLIEEEKQKIKCETKLEKSDWTQDIQQKTIDLSKYQFAEAGRVMTTILFYYLLHENDKLSRLDACKIVRDLILFMMGIGIRYFMHYSFDPVFNNSELMLNLLRNSIFVLFKLLLQELYPKDRTCQHSQEGTKKIKIYIASLLYFNELIEPNFKGKEHKFILNIFTNIKKKEDSPIQFSILKSNKKLTLQNFIDSIQNKNEILPDEYWNDLINPLPIVNEKGEMDYFQKSKVVHNARKLLYEIQKFIPLFPIDTEKINILKYPGIIIHYNSLNVSSKNYIKLCTFQKRIAENFKIARLKFRKYKKKIYNENEKNLNTYRSIKKQLFSWRNAWSNHELFYRNSDELKQKILNHYSQDLAQFMLIPILDINSYLPNFRFFKKENLFLSKKEFINLNVKQIFPSSKAILTKDKNLSTFLSNLYEHFTFMENFIIIKMKESMTNVDLCLIKKTHHIKCIFNPEEKKGLLFEFVYNEQGSGIDKKEILYDEENDTCYGSFFKRYEKDQYKTSFKISFKDFAFFIEKKYFYKNAIEIYTTNNKSYLFHGNNKSIKALKMFICENFSSLVPIKIKPVDQEIIGYFSGKLQSKYFPDKKGFFFTDILNMWKTNKISAFSFIIMSNIFGGRSFNDLTQYPIFPWTIKNYCSEHIDMEKDLRPFGCPMGNIDYYNSGRNEMFQSEYKEMENESKQLQNEDIEEEDERETALNKTKTRQQVIWENLDNEPFFYGTHYSNPIYVSHYLSRIFPFSQLRIELQGDNFDITRLFCSIEKTFESATTQKTDVRELIPEFFTLPEMFININKLNLGIEKTDVDLPKWSHNLSYEFVKVCRISLESDECQKNLNQWFDLIFGYKQIGPPAKEAKNIFMNHTYWGKVKIEYDNRKKYTKDEEYWINFFLRNVETGMSPRQLLQDKNTNKIIKKQEKNSFDKQTETEMLNFKTSSLIMEPIIFCGNDKSNLGEFCFITKNLKLLSFNLSDDRNPTFTSTTYISENFGDYNIRYFSQKQASNYVLEPKLFFVNANFWDNCIREYDLSNNNNKPQVIYCNEDKSLITSIAIKKDNSYAIIGTQKGSLIIYTITEEIEESKGLTIFNFFKVTKNKNRRVWKNIKIINDHYSEITTIAIKEELNILISTDKDGYTNIYTLPCFKLIRSIKLESFTKNIFISDSPLPCFVTFSNKEFQSFTINGNKIKIDEIDKSLRYCSETKAIQYNDILDYSYYRDKNWREYLIIGTANGGIEIRAFPEMKLIKKEDIFTKDEDKIFKLFVINEKTIIVLTENFKLYRIFPN